MPNQLTDSTSDRVRLSLGARGIVALATVAWLAACSEMPTGNDHPRVICYDTNHDGVIDYELHLPKKKGEITRWALRDDNFDGYYDWLIDYGDTIATRSPVHIPVPRNIQISSEDFHKAHPHPVTR